MPSVDDRHNFYHILGKARLFDGMYNLSTAIHHPPAAIKFLVWVSGIMAGNNASTVTFDIGFLTDPRSSARIVQAAGEGFSFAGAVGVALIEPGILRLSPVL